MYREVILYLNALMVFSISWKLVSSSKLQIESVQVTDDVSQKGQLCDPAWVFQLLVFLFGYIFVN